MRAALRQHVKLLLLRQELDVHTLAHGLPGERNQLLLQFAQSPLGRSDQIGDGRIGRSHLGEHLVAGYAAVHHPDAVCLAVLGFDLAQDAAQRRAVGGVSRQHLVGERKALRRHDQRNHDLHAVAALVAAVAVAALVRFIVRRSGLEIGAGEVIQQDFETSPEQVLPALAQMREQRLLVRRNLVQAAVERILLHQRIIRSEQIRHRALLEPQPVQSPLAPRIDQPIANQRLQDLLPAGSLARIRQTARPKPIQLKLLVEMTRQPTRTPLPRPMQLHRIEPHLHAIRLSVLWNRAIGGKQGQLRVAA
jgi:hypothetical protein